MQDRYAIMTRGFKNTLVQGHVTGFEVNLRIPYYRGTFLSLVHHLSLSVDGQPVPRESMRIVVCGRTFTLDEMEEADDVRWEFREPATLQVQREGGLRPGIHELLLGIVIRKSYLPPEDPEHLYDFFNLWKDGKYTTYIEAPTMISKRMTLVQ